MLDKLVSGMTLAPSEFIANLKPLIEAKRAEMDKSEFSKVANDIADAPPEEEEQKATSPSQDVEMKEEVK
jgi:hypothetical protein